MEQTILIVQRDPSSQSEVLGAFATAAPSACVFPATDDKEARAYLSGHGKYADRSDYPLPQIVLLDVDLIDEIGPEAVGWLRAETDRLGIPVIGMASEDPSKVNQAYKLGANACVLKGKDRSYLQQIAAGIVDYAAILGARQNMVAASTA